MCEARGLLDHHFGEFEVAVLKQTLGFADVLELHGAECVLDVFGVRLDDQDILRTNLGDARQPGQSPASPRQPDDLDVRFCRQLVEVPNAFSDHA